jgi:hypothetical protein
MRSSRPIPGNPWPHDMVIRITDDGESLTELLWLRAVLRLEPTGPDVPPQVEGLPEHALPSEPSRSDEREREQAWTELWDATLRHLADPADPGAFDALLSTGNGSEERLELLLALRGPSSRDRFGDALFDAEYGRWRDTLAQDPILSHRRRLEDDPERRCLDPLIGAWRRGLTTVITIPCTGTHTRTVGQHGLLVTRETRKDPARYAHALNQFETA